MQHYNAPWSRLLLATSSMATLACLGAALSLLLQGRGWLPPLSLVPLAILAGSALFTIRSYTITDQAILIHRLFWATRLPLAGLESARFEPQAMRGSIRTFGNGGLFSFTGFYNNKTLGPFRAFVTDRQKTVVLHYSDRTLVLSPDRPEDFVRDLPIKR